MFSVTKVPFTFKWNPRGAITGTRRIDCRVDAPMNVFELVEIDNAVSFLFDGNCMGVRRLDASHRSEWGGDDSYDVIVKRDREK